MILVRSKLSCGPEMIGKDVERGKKSPREFDVSEDEGAGKREKKEREKELK